MKTKFFLLCVISMSSASAWRVDRRCLEEGQMLAGDEVDRMFEIDSDENYEAVQLDDERFDWDDLTYYDFEDENEETSNLRGSSESLFRNQTALMSNATRKLQGGRTFNLKLTWKRGACWQDEWIERKWCMECRRSCNSGDVLELQSCSRSWKQRFQWQNGKLKVASKNMCLTKTGGLRLRPCGGGNQNFRGYQSSGGFELKPSGSSTCLSQHHHPKSGEVIELINCGLAASHNTNKWNVYWASGGGGGGGGGDDDDDDDDNDNDNNGGGGSGSLTKREKACSANNKCGKCVGDCDSDSQCTGNLKCVQRFGKNALATISGCKGSGKKGLDYCA